MEVQVIAYGIAKDILGGSSYQLALPENPTVSQLKNTLKEHFPAFADLASLAIAVNAEYASDEQAIAAGDEVVIIPPVAGG